MPCGKSALLFCAQTSFMPSCPPLISDGLDVQVVDPPPQASMEEVEHVPPSRNPIIPRLPPELLSCIMRQLFFYGRRVGLYTSLYDPKEEDAKDSLLTCSRVSFAMRQATLPFLFHVIAFSIRRDREHREVSSSDSSSDSDSDSDAECTCYTGRLSDIAVSLEAYPTICDHVRELRIRMGCPACSSDNKPQPLVTADLFEVARRFPKLRVLDVQNAHLPFDLQMRIANVEKTPLALEILNWAVSWGGMLTWQAVSLLHALGGAKRVTFSGIVFIDVLDILQEQFRTLPCPIELVSLRLRRCEDAGVLLNLLCTASASRPMALETLSLSPLRGADFPAVADFLRVHGAVLTSLTLDMSSLPIVAADWEHTMSSLCECRDLRSFEMCFESILVFKVACEHIALTFSTLRGRTKLRRVTFAIRTGLHWAPTQITRELMAPVEEALLAMPLIEKVAIEGVHAGKRWKRTMTEITRSCLPRLLEKGIVV